MSVTAFALGSPAAVDADAFPGLVASAVPSTIATIMLREDRFEGMYRVMRSSPSRGLSEPFSNYTDRQWKLSRLGARKNRKCDDGVIR
jgi:hypothetical protein